MVLKSIENISEHLVGFFLQAPVAMAYLKGPDLILEAANERMFEIWGRGESVLGLPFYTIFPELEQQIFPEIFSRVLETAQEYKGREMMAEFERNGKLHTGFFDFTCSAIRDSEGVIVGICIIASDVTSLVESKMQLAESEEKFRSLVLEADVATAIYIGREMKIELANEAMIKVWGRDSSVVGKTLREALPELEGQPFHDLLDNVFTTGKTYKATEDRVDLYFDGRLQTFYYNFSYKALRNKQGEVYGILNMAINVTEQVLAKKSIEQSQIALKESREMFVELADCMPQQVWATGADSKMNFINRVASDFFGKKLEDLSGPVGESVIHPEDVEQAQKKWLNSVAKLTPFETEYRLQDKLGKYRHFLSRAMPIRDSKGKLVRWIGTNTDIHEFKLLQRQKDDFLGIASHELKTPVTSIKAYTQVLEAMLRSEGDNTKADLLAKMDGQLNKFTALINDLLDTTKIQSGKMLFNKERFDLNETAAEIIEEIQRTTNSHRLVARFNSLSMVNADKERIGQVISNFLTNAIKYSPEGKEIIIETSMCDEFVQLAVKDSGIGIPVDKKELVFQQFYRVPGDREHTFPGIGLGLYICAEIIKRERGKIWVESRPGEGAVFYFTIPQYTENKDANKNG